jgi:hypothetical protein
VIHERLTAIHERLTMNHERLTANFPRMTVVHGTLTVIQERLTANFERLTTIVTKLSRRARLCAASNLRRWVERLSRFPRRAALVQGQL